MGEAEIGRGFIEQEAFLPIAFGGLVANADRGLPNLTGVAGGAGGQVALLGKRERRGRGAIEFDGDQGEAGLLEVGGEGAGQLGLSGGGDGIQKIADARVFVAVALEVGGDAGLEFLLAHPAFEHADDAGALLVSDAVEGVGDIVLGDDGLADFARGDQAVFAHGAELAAEVGEARVPFGLPFGEDLGRGPGGEGLVEPGVVPPGEGHQIAEPLMGELVGGHSGVGALALFGIDGGVGEDQVLGVGDHAGIFHGAEAEGEGDGDVVALLEGEGNAEVGLQAIDDGGGDFGGVFGLVGFAFGGDDAHRDVVLSGLAGVHEIEGADRDGDQIAGERTGGREDHLLHAVGLGGFGDGQRCWRRRHDLSGRER